MRQEVNIQIRRCSICFFFLFLFDTEDLGNKYIKKKDLGVDVKILILPTNKMVDFMSGQPFELFNPTVFSLKFWPQVTNTI